MPLALFHPEQVRMNRSGDDPDGAAPFFLSGAAPGTSVLAGIEDRDTASTRQCSVSLSGRSSLVKMLPTCFSAVPSTVPEPTAIGTRAEAARAL
jgi:hypothetical protein